jgi:hypothetical protein
MTEQPASSFTSFEEFWPFYVREHKSKLNRWLHFVGTSGAIACAVTAGVTRKRWMLGLAPVVGYGFAWIGHFAVEKNRPATFSHPLWSLKGDARMWWMTLRGSMDAEVERYTAAEPEVAATGDAAPNGERRADVGETDPGSGHLN